MHRDSYLQMNDDALLRACTLQGYQGSGPGGQHRNKTNTGVLLRLEELKLEIRCCEDRSAGINRNLALERMRLLIALRLRATPPPVPAFPFPGGKGRIQTANPGYAPFIADVLDRLELAEGDQHPAAAAWNLSASALVRIFFSDKALLETVQQIRAQYGKPPLRAPGS